MFLRASLVPVASAIVLLVVAVMLANEVLVYVAFGLTGVSVLLVALGLFAPNVGRRPTVDTEQQQTGAVPPSTHEPMGQPPVSAQSTQWTPPPMATPPQQRWQYPTTGPGPVPEPSGPLDPQQRGRSSHDSWSGPPVQGGPVVDIEGTPSPAGAAGDTGATHGPAVNLPQHAPNSDTPADDASVLHAPDAAPHVEGDDGDDPEEPQDNTRDDEIVTAESATDPEDTESEDTESEDTESDPEPSPSAAEDIAGAPATIDDTDQSRDDDAAPANAGVVRSRWEADVFADATDEHTRLDRDPTAGPQPVDPTEPEDSTTFALDSEGLTLESATAEDDEPDPPRRPEDTPPSTDEHDAHAHS